MKDRRFIERTLDWFLIFCVMIVILCGVLTLYAQEVNIAEGAPGRWYKQLLYAGIGLVGLLFMTRINYQLLGSYALLIYLVAIVLLGLTLVPGIGYLPSGRGARSWLKLGPFSIQTSEFAKLSTVILLGQYLVIKEREMRNISVLLIPFLIVIIPMGLIAKQPDFGTSMSFLPILLAMLYLGGADMMHISSLIILGGVTLVIPLYIEYTKITLVEPLVEYLAKIEKAELANIVNQMKGKVWMLLRGKEVKIGEKVVNLSPKSMKVLNEASEQVIEDNTGFLFKTFSNDDFMIGLALVFLIVSFVLIMLRYARGSMQFRRYYIPLGMVGLSLLAAVTLNRVAPFSENQVGRFTAFINPEKFRQGAGYQLLASKPAIGSGRILGKGLMNAEMTEGKTPHVPESGTDFIFASWAEQTGFFGSVILLFFILAIPLRGLQISFESKDRFGSLLAAGVVALIFFHMLINLGIVLGLMPVTGLPLSFMSYGGSHLIMSMMAVGIIISVKMRKHAN